MQEYTLMSFNVRMQTLVDLKQQFMNRVGFLTDYLKETAPDVCGFQELSHAMRLEILKRMPGYGILGGGREKDRRGEAAAILYKEDRLMPERVFTEMLSYAPHVPGSTYGGDQSGCPRVFTSVDFVPFDSGKAFRFMNVHLDHIGANARKLELAQVLRSYDEQQAFRPMPTILTGDFNVLPDAEELRLIDDHGAFTDLTKDVPGTFHFFGKLDEPKKIDYIYAAGRYECTAVRLDHKMRDGLYLSDHDPVVAEVWLP